MQVMTDRQSVAANTTVANIMSGKLHELIGRPSKVRVFMAASAVGMNATVMVGSQSFIQDQEISSANRTPIVPDDFLVDAGGKSGDRIVVSLRNTTGAAITVNTRVEVHPISLGMR